MHLISKTDLCEMMLNKLHGKRENVYLCSPVPNARMAELVDALVSKTNGVIPVPVRSRLRVLKEVIRNHLLFALKILTLNLLAYCFKNSFFLYEYILHQKLIWKLLMLRIFKNV
jgi:hypothetical protein